MPLHIVRILRLEATGPRESYMYRSRGRAFVCPVCHRLADRDNSCLLRCAHCHADVHYDCTATRDVEVQHFVCKDCVDADD